MLYFEITKEFFFSYKSHSYFHRGNFYFFFHFLDILFLLSVILLFKDTILSARTKNDRYSGDSL